MIMATSSCCPCKPKNNKRRFVSNETFEQNFSCRYGDGGSFGGFPSVVVDDGDDVLMAQGLLGSLTTSDDSFRQHLVEPPPNNDVSSPPLVSSCGAESQHKRGRWTIDCNGNSTTDISATMESSCAPLLSESGDTHCHNPLHRSKSSVLSISSTFTEASNTEVLAAHSSSGSSGSKTMMIPTTESSYSLDVLPSNNMLDYPAPDPSRLDSLTDYVKDLSLSNRRAKRRGNITSASPSFPSDFFQGLASAMPEEGF